MQWAGPLHTHSSDFTAWIWILHPGLVCFCYCAQVIHTSTGISSLRQSGYSVPIASLVQMQSRVSSKGNVLV